LLGGKKVHPRRQNPGYAYVSSLKTTGCGRKKIDTIFVRLNFTKY